MKLAQELCGLCNEGKKGSRRGPRRADASDIVDILQAADVEFRIKSDKLKKMELEFKGDREKQSILDALSDSDMFIDFIDDGNVITIKFK